MLQVKFFNGRSEEGLKALMQAQTGVHVVEQPRSEGGGQLVATVVLIVVETEHAERRVEVLRGVSAG
jgi:hypothetical protein